MHSLNGIFPLAKFQLSDYFPLEIKAETAEFAILNSFVKSDIETISFLISTKPVVNKNKFKVFLLDLEISNFYFMKEALAVKYKQIITLIFPNRKLDTY